MLLLLLLQYKSVMEASFESTKELFVAPTIPVAKLKKNSKTSSVTKTKKSKKIVSIINIYLEIFKE